jgi:hypothetical protein
MKAGRNRILFLVLEGLSPDRRHELQELARENPQGVEILPLTEENGREALEKIFAADGVSIWGGGVG